MSISRRETELERMQRVLREGDEWRERVAGWLARAAGASAQRRVVSVHPLADGSCEVVERWASRAAYLEVSQTLEQMRELATFSADELAARPHFVSRA